jgi:hypothetical protein
MVQRTVRYGVIATPIPTSFLSLVILLSVAHYNDAQAQSRAAGRACGKELMNQCTGVPVRANNMLECLEKNRERLSSRCVASAHNVVRRCERDAAQHCQAVVAGQGNILGCLTAARRMVSARCNAALDAAYLRQ